MTIAVIGDDLTGCMDAGIQLAKKGYSVNVAISSKHIKHITSQCDVIIVDTESRNLPPEEAYSKVSECLNNIYGAGLSLKYKKVDSTLRGNIGSELEAILHYCNMGLIVFVPALPYNNRITMEGIQYLDGFKLTDSDIAKDPFSPIISSYIPEIVKLQTKIMTAIIKLSDVRRGSINIAAKFNELRQKGFRIVVVDCKTEEDLINIADALKKCEINTLPCGSAGLFAYILDNKQDNKRPTNRIPEKNNKPVLVISGSPAIASKLQIEKARAFGENLIKLDMNKYNLNDGEWFNSIKDVALRILKSGENLIIDGAGEGKSQIYKKYKDHITDLSATSKIIQNALSQIFQYLCKEVNLGGVVIIGGDTAFNICNKLSVKGLKINREVEPYVPFGFAAGGDIDELPIITKAGSFGSQDVILKAIKYLKGEIYDNNKY